jgi:hypothetical protein
MLHFQNFGKTDFLRDSESLSILLQVINESIESDVIKSSACHDSKLIFNQIIFALCTPRNNSIVKHSNDPILDVGISSPDFNSLAYCEVSHGGGTTKHITYSFYGGLNRFSSPNSLSSFFKFDLSFLRRFNIHMSRSILSPLDMVRLCFLQRVDSPKAILDIHNGFSAGSEYGHYSASFGGDIMSILTVITEHYKFIQRSPDSG